MVGFDEFKERVDLAALVAADLGPPRKQRGRWWWWLCPFHAEKTPSFGVTPDDGRFKCFGCGESGDHITWLEKRRNLSTREAIQELKRLAALPEGLPAPPAGDGGGAQSAGQMRADGPPPAAWQEAARAFVAYAQEQLWAEAGAPGLAYLRAGGLRDGTIRRWGLGWNPAPLRRDPRCWGLKGGPVYLPRGVVIPCQAAGALWYVKIRRFEGDRAADRNKYPQPRGGRAALFGADDLRADGGQSARGRPLLLTEGERDAMLAHQELDDLVDVATLGGAGRRSLGRWAACFLPYRSILVAYDADSAGRDGAAWLSGLSRRVQVLQVPAGGDLTGFHAGGGDLRAWLREHLEPVAGAQTPAAAEAVASPAPPLPWTAELPVKLEEWPAFKERWGGLPGVRLTWPDGAPGLVAVVDSPPGASPQMARG